jgi:hypothetical protein
VIREAYKALGQGELEPLVALMDDDVEWSGRRSGCASRGRLPLDAAPTRPGAVLTSGIEDSGKVRFGEGEER